MKSYSTLPKAGAPPERETKPEPKAKPQKLKCSSMTRIEELLSIGSEGSRPTCDGAEVSCR